LRLVEPWQSLKSFPRLQADGFLFRLTGGSNLSSRATLAVDGAENIRVACLNLDVLGLSPHHSLHSRRMGQILGQLLRPAPREESLADLRSVVLPNHSDTGEPVPQEQYEHWLALFSDQRRLAGWRLDSIDVQLDDSARKMAVDVNGSPPDLFLRLSMDDQGRVLQTTSTATDNIEPQFAVGWYFEAGRTVRIEAYDRDVFGSTSLGTHTISIGESVPDALFTDHDQGIHWSADLKWTRLHY